MTVPVPLAAMAPVPAPELAPVTAPVMAPVLALVPAPVKVGFSQKVMAKFSNLSNCHSCEPKIVPAHLIPVNDNNKILAIL